MPLTLAGVVMTELDRCTRRGLDGGHAEGYALLVADDWWSADRSLLRVRERARTSSWQVRQLLTWAVVMGFFAVVTTWVALEEWHESGCWFETRIIRGLVALTAVLTAAAIAIWASAGWHGRTSTRIKLAVWASAVALSPMLLAILPDRPPQGTYCGPY
jgi:hypothetical protein